MQGKKFLKKENVFHCYTLTYYYSVYYEQSVFYGAEIMFQYETAIALNCYKAFLMIS